MIESIDELSDLELRIAVMGITGYSENGIAKCLKLSDNKIQQAIDSINKKCEKSFFASSLLELCRKNIIWRKAGASLPPFLLTDTTI